MAKKRVFSIQFEPPGDAAEELSFESGRSLLDADIIIFKPTVSPYYDDTYQGKPSLSDDRSVSLLEDADHWRREISDALATGKTVFVIASALQEYYVGTGGRTYSGTGRNRQVTRQVTGWNNYQSLPIELDPVASKGQGMTLTADGQVLGPLWKEFKQYFEYEVYFTADGLKPYVLTTHGARKLGGLFESKSQTGSLIILPNIDFDVEELVETRADEDGEEANFWTNEALAIGQRFINSLIETDKVIRGDRAITPAPGWSSASTYELESEREIRRNLLKLDSQLTELAAEKQTLKSQLVQEGRFRGLLYEKGDALEDAIIAALKCLGFEASGYRDSNSEFDVVFESPEGRMIGEAEGRDEKQVGIGKLRQLEMNLLEDFDREEVEEMAKGALFGNAQRLASPESRGQFFTDKCLTAAKRTGTALVCTPDLFSCAKYLVENPDLKYAKECRETLLSCEGGIVKFPVPPRLKIEKEVTQTDKTEETLSNKAHNKSRERIAKGDRSS